VIITKEIGARIKPQCTTQFQPQFGWMDWGLERGLELGVSETGRKAEKQPIVS